MSTLTGKWVPVPSLFVGAQINYLGDDFIVLEVMEQKIGGWVVIGNEIGDHAQPARRWPLVYGCPVAEALLSHRAVEVAS